LLNSGQSTTLYYTKYCIQKQDNNVYNIKEKILVISRLTYNNHHDYTHPANIHKDATNLY